MTRKFAEWASEHGPITKIRPSDGCGKKFFSTAVGSVHHRIRFEDYLGNVDWRALLMGALLIGTRSGGSH